MTYKSATNHEGQAGEMSVFITLGKGKDLGITNAGNLVIVDLPGYRINLGQATKKRIDDVISYLTRLKIHATDAWPNDGS